MYAYSYIGEGVCVNEIYPTTKRTIPESTVIHFL